MIKPITSQRSLKAHTMEGLKPATEHECPVLAGAPPLREHRRLPSPRPESRASRHVAPLGCHQHGAPQQCHATRGRLQALTEGCSTHGRPVPPPRGRDTWERRHRPPGLGQAAATRPDLGQVGADSKSRGERQGKRTGLENSPASPSPGRARHRF